MTEQCFSLWHDILCALLTPFLVFFDKKTWILFLYIASGIVLKQTVSASTRDSLPEVTKKPQIDHVRPCPEEVNECSRHGLCEERFRRGQWRAVCSCESDYFGRHCELFRPPGDTPDRGLVTTKQATLLAGGIFLAVIVIIIVSISIYVTVKYFRNRKSQGQGKSKSSQNSSNQATQPLMDCEGQLIAPGANNNNIVSSDVSMKAMRVQDSSLTDDEPQANV